MLPCENETSYFILFNALLEQVHLRHQLYWLWASSSTAEKYCHSCAMCVVCRFPKTIKQVSCRFLNKSLNPLRFQYLSGNFRISRRAPWSFDSQKFIIKSLSSLVIISYHPVTLTLTRWPSYTNLTCIPPVSTRWPKINFLRQRFRKLSYCRHTDTHKTLPRRFAGGNNSIHIYGVSCH